MTDSMLLDLLKKAGEVVFGKAADQGRRYLARSRANKGGDALHDGTFEGLVRKELAGIAKNPKKLPEGLQGIVILDWLMSEEFLELFLSILLSSGDAKNSSEEAAFFALAQQYEEKTGDSAKTAMGAIKLVADQVMAVIEATEVGRQALHLSLTRTIAARVRPESTENHQTPILTSDVGQLKKLSEALLQKARITWQFPKFIAPVNLETIQVKQNERGQPVSQNQLVEYIRLGEKIVLYGDGGIGKTTFLLELAGACGGGEVEQLPLYIDASAWANRRLELWDYVAGTNIARTFGVSGSDLQRFAGEGKIILLINGWNEIPHGHRLECQNSLDEILALVPTLPVVIVSRDSNDTGSFQPNRRISVQGISWAGQIDIVQKELEKAEAEQLISRLQADNQLRYAARSPLILRGLISQARMNVAASSARYDLLKAVMVEVEEHSARKPFLDAEPLSGHQDYYLQEIACAITSQLAPSIPKLEALAAIGRAADRLRQATRHAPIPEDVLQILSKYHVLHVDDGAVRFAHQRFLEYYAATRIYELCRDSTESHELLEKAGNEPFWADAIALVAEKLRLESESVPARRKLVAIVYKFDLSYACELASACRMTMRDAPELYTRMVDDINLLCTSPLGEVQELGLACQILAGFPEFSGHLWDVYENPDDDIRLSVHRLRGASLSIAQLGPDAEDRISKWSVNRRREFVSELGDNPDNHSYLERVVLTDTEPTIRVSAINALFWHYPASGVALRAWLFGPPAVQMNQTTLSYIEEFLEMGIEADAISKKIRELAVSDLPNNDKLHLALKFPMLAGAASKSVLIEHLRNEERYGNAEPLLSIAHCYAGEELEQLTVDFCLGHDRTPGWIVDSLKLFSQEKKEWLFREVWNRLDDREFVDALRAEEIGPLATAEQIRGAIHGWLDYKLTKVPLATVNHSRFGAIQKLLWNVSGDLLLSGVLEASSEVTYEKASELVELIWMRCTHEEEGNRFNPWLPSTADVEIINSTFCVFESVAPAGDTILIVTLARIASRVAPEIYKEKIFEAFDKSLVAAQQHVEDFRERVQNRPGEAQILRDRSHAREATDAVVELSFSGLGDLSDRITAPRSLDFVVPAMGRIMTKPWHLSNRVLHNTLPSAIEEGRRRRENNLVSRQPKPDIQDVTDAGGRILAQLLDDELAKNEGSRIDNLVRYLALIPSNFAAEALERGLVSGRLNMWQGLHVIEGLYRQGRKFENRTVVHAIEKMYLCESTKQSWFSPQEHEALGQICHAILSVENFDDLAQGAEYYLREWRTHSYPSEMLRRLGAASKSNYWNLILKIVELYPELPNTEEIGYALAGAFSTEHYDDFLRLLESGKLFEWCRGPNSIESFALKGGEIAKSSHDKFVQMIQACRLHPGWASDTFVEKIMVKSMADEKTIVDLEMAMVDSGSSPSPMDMRYRKMMSMFRREEPITSNQFEIFPKACNELRYQLYLRARDRDSSSDWARRMLAALEVDRRENGRPSGEPRHPAPEDGNRWTDCLLTK